MDTVTVFKMNFRKEQWKQRIIDCQASGLTIDKWCQQQGLRRITYFRWLRILRSESCQSLAESVSSTPVPFVKINNEEVSTASHTPDIVSQPTNVNNVIHIQLCNADITIPNGTNPKTIRGTLLALKELC